MTTHNTLGIDKASAVSIAVCIVLVVLAVLVEDLWFLSIVSTVICGFTILGGLVNDIRGRRLTARCLAVAALVASLLLKEFILAAQIAIIMSVGELLDRAVANNARSGIVALGKLRVDRAHIVEGDNVYSLPIEDIRAGRLIRVYPGEVIPLDGIIIQGSSSVDRSIMTGESVPVDVCVGDEVLSGTCNLSNTIDVRVEREESSGLTNHMSTLLRDAESKSARATGTADRWTRFVLLAAAIAAIATYLITNDGRLALTVMLLLCPCAFMLATPAVALAAAGGMAKNGIILKDASAIEGMDRVDTVLFDKTGTLTTGVIRSLGFTNLSSDMPAEKIEGLVASLETYSEHPLGMAISTDHRHIGIVEDFHYIPGQGVVGTVDGISIAAGTTELMSSEAPDGLDAAVSMAREQPLTLVYVGIEGRCVGFFRLEDTLKNGARATVQELHDMGLRTAMLTGDNKTVAQQVAEDLGIDLAVWDCRPETKLNSVENLEGTGRTCMIGDGMNDAPSLRRATVGIAMGVMGNDVSVKSSDIVLVDDDISKLPGIYRSCRRSTRIGIAGLLIAMGIGIAGAAVTLAGVSDPAMGAIVHNCGSLAVVLLSSTILLSGARESDGQGKNQ